MEISELTPAEQRVWHAFPRGAVVDFRESEEDDAAHGDTWGRDRVVRGEVLRTLLLDGASPAQGVPGLWLRGAYITGQLDLAHGTVDHGVRLLDCRFEQPPILYGASTRQLDLSGSQIPGLLAADVRVDGVLRLTGCRLTGRTSLSTARVSNSLFLDQARASGPIRLDGARIDNALVLEDARLTGDAPEALRAVNAGVSGSVLGKNLLAHGELVLTGLRVGASFDLEGADLVNPGGEALSAAVITVNLDLLCTDLRA